MSADPVIIWFRQDLRLADNPALLAACATRQPVIPVFILDDESAGQWKHGAASRWWLHESLKALNDSMGGAMVFRRGDARTVLPELIRQCGAKAVYWNRCYEPWRIARDKDIKQTLQLAGIEV